MARKRALVVDDSKSARVILSRMLEKYDIEVDMAESAENAITAMIPIMMYTSQEGELYVGQARALGAMGVLPKQLRPVDVSKVLYELHLVPNRRDGTEPSMLPVDLEGAPPPPPAAASSDIRRFIVASLDSFAVRIVSEVRDSVTVPTLDPIAPPVRPPRPSWGWPAAAAGVMIIAAAFAAAWIGTRNQLAGVRADIAALRSENAELQRTRGDLSAAVKDLTAALATANNGAASDTQGAPSPAGATLRVEPVPYGEIPFDHTRLDALRELLTNLESQGFHGVVRITNLAGIYCLSGNASDGYTPAAPALPVTRCDLIGNPFSESLSEQQRESLAFANLVAGVRQRTSGAITVALDSEATGKHASVPYPAHSDSLTAGEWNRAAAANNRVEFSAESSGP
jgi:hypothetical protein